MELFHRMRFPVFKSSLNLPKVLSKFGELSSSGRWKEVLYHYKEIKNAGTEPIDHSIFSHILKACLALSSPGLGMSVHSSLIKQGFEAFSSVGNTVMDFYAKCGALDSAMGIFNCMNIKDSVSWNIILHGYLDQGAFEEGLELFFQARMAKFEPNVSTLLLIIQAYQSLQTFAGGQKFHGFLIQSGLWSFTSVQNSLLSWYTDIGMEYAETLFWDMYDKDVITWSVMIKGYVRSSEISFALETFRHMSSQFGIEADGKTMVSVIKGCSDLGDIRIGKLIHAFVLLRGLSYDLFVGNSLIDFYCKCSDIDSAVKVFNEMPHRNIVSWNSLLSGFVHNEKYSEALTLFSLMVKLDVEADEVSLVSLLQACKVLGNLCQCKLIHCRVIRRGFELNESAMNSLIDAYAKCSQINHAWRIFSLLERPDIVTWTTMISGFTHCGMPDEAISIYCKMRLSLENPTPVTLLNLFEACALSAEITRSKLAHGIACRMGLASDVVVGTAIVDMYSKCGAIGTSRRVFDHISEKNIVSWTAMIAAYGLNGLPCEALSLLSNMKILGLNPNPVTSLSLLSACCHGGLVEEGLSIFKDLAQRHESELKLEHFSCLVDLLARSGNLTKAMDIIKSIPASSASAWGAILSACRNYENREFAAKALSRVLELEPSSSAGYLLASNMYAAGGSWTDASGMRRLVKEQGLKVVAGYSLVFVNNKGYSFTAGDKYQTLSSTLGPVIAQLHLCMKIDTRATMPMVP